MRICRREPFFKPPPRFGRNPSRQILELDFIRAYNEYNIQKYEIETRNSANKCHFDFSFSFSASNFLIYNPLFSPLALAPLSFAVFQIPPRRISAKTFRLAISSLPALMRSQRLWSGERRAAASAKLPAPLSLPDIDFWPPDVGKH